MKKKSIMGIEYKWEVFLVYLLPILGLIFSFMKDKEVDKDVKFQYNQSAVIFIFSLAVNILSRISTSAFGIPYIAWVLSILSFVVLVFEIITIVKAFSNETYRIPVFADLAEKNRIRNYYMCCISLFASIVSLIMLWVTKHKLLRENCSSIIFLHCFSLTI